MNIGASGQQSFLLSGRGKQAPSEESEYLSNELTVTFDLLLVRLSLIEHKRSPLQQTCWTCATLVHKI